MNLSEEIPEGAILDDLKAATKKEAIGLISEIVGAIGRSKSGIKFDDDLAFEIFVVLRPPSGWDLKVVVEHI
jgi:hypothetical protein